jgi:hypothetical protein
MNSVMMMRAMFEGCRHLKARRSSLMDVRCLAEAVRFELTEDSHPRRFSRPVHSTALPSFRVESNCDCKAGIHTKP